LESRARHPICPAGRARCRRTGCCDRSDIAWDSAAGPPNRRVPNHANYRTARKRSCYTLAAPNRRAGSRVPYRRRTKRASICMCLRPPIAASGRSTELSVNLIHSVRLRRRSQCVYTETYGSFCRNLPTPRGRHAFALAPAPQSTYTRIHLGRRNRKSRDEGLKSRSFVSAQTMAGAWIEYWYS